MFASLLAQLFESGESDLPRQRGALLSEAIDLLLGSWSIARTGEDSVIDYLGCSSDQLLARLEVVALKSSEAISEGAFREDPLIPRSLILDELYELGTHVNPSEALEYISQHAGILASPAPRTYRFAHRLFQEYLAACAIAAKETTVESMIAYLEASGPTWREVALLLADVLSNTRRTGDIWELVCGLAASPVPDVRLVAAEIILQHDSLLKPGRLFTSFAPSLREQFTSDLTVLELSAVERSRIGRALDLVGDSRPGVGLTGRGDPDVVWCDIPSGNAVIGTNDQSRAPLLVFPGEWTYEREEPTHRLHVSGFLMSRVRRHGHSVSGVRAS